LKEVLVRQRQLFGEIEVVRNPNNVKPGLKAGISEGEDKAQDGQS